LAGTVLLLLAAPAMGHRAAAAQGLPERVRERLSAEPRDPFVPLMEGFYGRRAYRPAWVSDSGPSPLAGNLLAIIEAADAEGLDPNDYPHAAIRALLNAARAPDTLARLDLLLTRTLLAYGTDVSRGRIDPAAADSPWTAAPRPVDLGAALESALGSGGPAQALERLAPPQAPYAALRRALQRYRDAAAHGGWPAVPAGPELVPGTRDSRVAILRTRLVSEADLAPGDDSGDVYDAAAVQAVRRFQTRHGLDPDGVLGAETLAALNVPVSQRIGQIELNLERWRWPPRSLGLRYIMVNSAAFTLEVVDSARQVMTMRAIVGRSDRPTPIVSGRITGVIFDPVWNVPRSIAVEEVLPLVQRDPRYLEQHTITVFEDSSRTALQVDPGTIDWAAMTEESFNLHLRQAPGGDNPLGGVKVVFGSRFNVTIHDTPLRSLFRERVRTFSHGCIRVDRASDLVTYLLQDSVRWRGDSVRARMAGATEEAVTLPQPVPVHLSYWTAWVDDRGWVHFRDDVYGWDARLADALASHRPRSP
jgi:murein L,D-transpeptidase YcbB/YkuD